jgi:cell division septal protein FtsQ
MTKRTPRRYRTAAGTPRRQPRVRRASAGLTPTRAAALLAMLIAAGAVYGLSATSAFGFERLQVDGATLTSDADLRTQIALDQGTNLVGLSTGPIADRIRLLPSVRDVAVSVGLPDQLVVHLTERHPIVVWAVGDRRFAVDDGGLLFADVTTDPTGATASIPVVDDEREASNGIGVGAVLDPVIRDAATRLGSLTPSDVGSRAPALRVHVTDDHGFTISSGPGGWTAVFGKYGLSQRTTALIPGQVQALDKLLLADPEDTMAMIILADDRDGTFTLKPTPRPSAGAKP